MKLALIFSMLLLASTVNSQSIDSLLNAYNSSHYVEKIYVAMDKPYYVLEDEIWAKAYVVYGRSHVLTNTEPILYADWIDPEGRIIDSYQLKVKNGVAPFSIKTTLFDQVGAYKLRVYSPYQLNFAPEYIWQKEVRLLNNAEFLNETKDSAKNVSIQFFPEGGYLVDGLQSKLAYKVVGIDNEEEFKGVIKDEKENIISEFSIWNNGIGQVDITPEHRKKYYAELEYKSSKVKINLPPQLAEGYVLTAQSTDDKKIRVTLNSNLPQGLKGVQMIAHVRGEIVSSFTLDNPSSKITLALEKEKMPSGIIHLTLFDPNGQPVAERLIFNRNPKEQMNVAIQVEPLSKKRQAVSGSISVFLDSVAISASANISIYNRDVLPDEWRSTDIQSYLWLESDLKGNIDFIGDYLSEDNNRSRYILDLTLATHGWRRFDWQKVLQSEYPQVTTLSEENTVISGRVTKVNSDRPVKADVTLNITNKKLFAALQLTTDENGYFQFEGIDLPDSTDILVQAATHKKKRSKKIKEGTQKLTGNKYVKVAPTTLPSSSLDSVAPLQHYPFINRKKQDVLKDDSSTQSDNRSKVLDNTAWALNLDEVVVSTRRFSAQAKNDEIQKKYKEKGIFFFSSTDKFLADDPLYDGVYYATVHDLLRAMIPGSKKITRLGEQAVAIGSLSDGAVARIAVNGQLIPPEREKLLSPADVYSVDILNGLRCITLYDEPLVISILTREPGEPAKIRSPNLFNINHPGYHKARNYYIPSAKEIAAQADYRTTIFWDPNVKFKSGKYDFSFRTSDLSGIHQIVVEGLTLEGLPFVQRKFFRVED